MRSVLGISSCVTVMVGGLACTSTPAPTPTPAPAGPAAVVVAGFSTPESVLHDVANDVYLVSNVNGVPTEKDNNGFISRVGPDGAIQNLTWIDGAKDGVTLHAPKGMAIIAGKLYVSDIDNVRVFDLNTGAPITAIPIEGATFLNDVTEGKEGAVLVSDSGLKVGAGGFEPTGSDAVYNLTPFGEVLPILKEASLPRPNGLAVDGANTWIAYFAAARIDAVDDAGTITKSVTLPGGSLDGIVVMAPGVLLVSSWESNSVYQVDTNADPAAISVVASEVVSPADIGYDASRRTLMVPHFTTNTVSLIKLP